jgi:hypothetical protein
MPHASLQRTALITVTPDPSAAVAESSAAAAVARLALLPPPPAPAGSEPAAPASSWPELSGQWAAEALGLPVGAGASVSLELDDCKVTATGRDRDLIRVDGGGAATAAAALVSAAFADAGGVDGDAAVAAAAAAALTAATAAHAASGGVAGVGASVKAKYCQLRGGSHAAVATLRASLHLDCCVLEVRAGAQRLRGCTAHGGEGGRRAPSRPSSAPLRPARRRTTRLRAWWRWSRRCAPWAAGCWARREPSWASRCARAVQGAEACTAAQRQPLCAAVVCAARCVLRPLPWCPPPSRPPAPQAVSASVVSAVGCFLRGHASNLEAVGGSVVDMQVGGQGRRGEGRDAGAGGQLMVGRVGCG